MLAVPPASRHLDEVLGAGLGEPLRFVAVGGLAQASA